jgi:gamma-glutamylcyclotransferase (GGCT)/AIG2-like uncharacterized protein YtfP
MQQRLKKPKALFVYGSLMEPQARARILGHEVEAISARIRGYERRRSTYFYLAARPGFETSGLVLTGLMENDFHALDEYEEVPHLYTRERIQVLTTTADEPLECWVYLPTERLTNQSRGRTET